MIKRITSPLAAPIWFPNNSNTRFKKDVNELNQIIKDLIKNKKSNLGDDLLSSLLQLEDADSGEKMSDQQLIDETLTLFLAGHETTAITLTWLTICLVKNHIYLDKIHQECTEKPIHKLMQNQ